MFCVGVPPPPPPPPPIPSVAYIQVHDYYGVLLFKGRSLADYWIPNNFQF